MAKKVFKVDILSPSSLEKLKNNNFSIGLISHLAELKSRIDNKILVTSADETKGSSIKVIF